MLGILGVIFDKNFTFCSHVWAVWSSCFYHIRDLQCIRRHLDQDSAKLLATTLVSSNLDYYNYNSLLYAVADTDFTKLTMSSESTKSWTKSPLFTRSVSLLFSTTLFPTLVAIKLLNTVQDQFVDLKNASWKAACYSSLPACPITAIPFTEIKQGNESVRNICRHITLTWPFSLRHWHTRQAVSAMELLHQYCFWTLIRLSRHWVWLRQGYWSKRNLIDWFIEGSVLGPLLFTLYTIPLSSIVSGHAIPHHLYVDDSQLYVFRLRWLCCSTEWLAIVLSLCPIQVVPDNSAVDWKAHSRGDDRAHFGGGVDVGGEGASSLR